jgi:hypothetical protein
MKNVEKTKQEQFYDVCFNDRPDPVRMTGNALRYLPKSHKDKITSIVAWNEKGEKSITPENVKDIIKTKENESKKKIEGDQPELDKEDQPDKGDQPKGKQPEPKRGRPKKG